MAAQAPPPLRADPVWRVSISPEWHTLRVFGLGRHGAFDAGTERHNEL